MSYEVIVVGAGHAGCEAALAAARLGARTLVITSSLETIAALSCNPAIGGPAAKSHLVRELDALGGEMGRIADRAYLNIRRLNESRGPAVTALRAQVDRRRYQTLLRSRLEQQTNLQLKQGTVTQLLVSAGRVTGVRLQSGREYCGATVILASGTFLGGMLVMGAVRYPGGRQGEPAATELSADLQGHGLKLRRFQTATPPRIQRRSVDFSRLTPQPLQELEWGFSWDGLPRRRSQIPCWLTGTTPATIKVIQANLGASPLCSGSVTGPGPHFCPSIDRKVINFPDQTNHQIFLEPEGPSSEEIYLLGLTTALPEQVQEAILATIPGLERAQILRPGYAVEYDCLDSWQFDATLESKQLSHFFTAGQVNGTSGYEEAAVQGLVAGVNAVRKLRQQPPLISKRTDSYIGVLIDDLVTQGTQEPYRIMTARAEFRLRLRLDNSLIRLGEIGRELGLTSGSRWRKRQQLLDQIVVLNQLSAQTRIKPSPDLAQVLRGGQPQRSYRLAELVLRPELSEAMLRQELPQLNHFAQPVWEYFWNELRLAGYLQRQQDEWTEACRLEAIMLPLELAAGALAGLSDLARQAYRRVQPRSLGQALRLTELTPADRSWLILQLQPRDRQTLKRPDLNRT